jgi:hypothetical protein
MNNSTKSVKSAWRQATDRRWQILLLLGLWAVSVFAQSTSGNIVGTVYDGTGATVPNASVVARNIATGVETSTISTSSGQYRIANLPIGTYCLSITAGGFAPAQITNIPVVLNQTVTSNATLQLQKTSTTVVVNEAGTAIDTTTAQVQTTFDSRQMQDLSIASGTSGVISFPPECRSGIKRRGRLRQRPVSRRPASYKQQFHNRRN